MRKIAFIVTMLCLPALAFAQSSKAKASKPDTTFASVLQMPSLHSSSPYTLTPSYYPPRHYQTPTDKQVDSVYRDVFKMEEAPIYFEKTNANHQQLVR